MPPTGTFAGPFVGTAGGAAGSASAFVDVYCLGSDFLTTADGNIYDGIRHVQLSLTADGSGNTLTRTITRNPFDASATPVTETLAKNVVSFDAKYFDGQNWNDAWDSTSLTNAALPLAVELTISVKKPTNDNADKLYTLTRIVTLPCGQTADQTAAVAAAASTATSTGDTGTGTDATGTGGTTP
ncbi:MAG: type II secretion system protein GspJ [Tepidisphaeraceae bacterium]